jgi:hypothetical protein
MKGAAETLLARLRDAILKQSARYPDPNFASYLGRRIDYKLEPSRLASMDAEAKAGLARELRGELEQLKRITKMANLYAGEEGGLFRTVLDAKPGPKASSARKKGQ